MSPCQRISDQPTESRIPRTRLEGQRAEEGEFDSLEFTNQIQREAEGRFSGIPKFYFNSLEVTGQAQQEAEGEFREFVRLVTDSSLDEE